MTGRKWSWLILPGVIALLWLIGKGWVPVR